MYNKFIINTPSVCDIKLIEKFGNAYRVTADEPLQVHRAVEEIAGYFKHEGRFDFIQYTAHEDIHSKNSHAYIWIEEDWQDTIAIGACEFRYLGDVGQIKDWSLEWVWMHPYRRCRGLLSDAWPAFVEYYGKDFHIAPPLSREMRQFLNKMDHKFKE